MKSRHILLAVVMLAHVASSCQNHAEEIVGFFGKKGTTNNWAVIVCTSRFWFNYRHIANALSIYYTVKRLGIPDTQIILMLADDMACNARNSFPAHVFNSQTHLTNLYRDDVEVDYRGYDVSVETFIRLLTGRHDESVPRSKRLLTDDQSNILVYMSGHGGDEFLKFQDVEEIHSQDVADAFEQMHQQQRYGEMLFIADTCQASTLANRLYSPNIAAIGSSSKGEMSLSHHNDRSIGVSVIDRFTFYVLDRLNALQVHHTDTLLHLVSSLDPSALGARPQYRTDLFNASFAAVPLTSFFASVPRIELVSSNAHVPLTPLPLPAQPAPAQPVTSLYVSPPHNPSPPAHHPSSPPLQSCGVVSSTSGPVAVLCPPAAAPPVPADTAASAAAVVLIAAATLAMTMRRA